MWPLRLCRQDCQGYVCGLCMNSDPAVNREGVAVDDIHVYDNTMGIYNGVTMSSPVTKTISGGTSWVDFTSAGKLIASIQPGGRTWVVLMCKHLLIQAQCGIHPLNIITIEI